LTQHKTRLLKTSKRTHLVKWSLQQSPAVLASPSSGSQSGFFWESDYQFSPQYHWSWKQSIVAAIIPLEGSHVFCGTRPHSLICL
jgi:hypothetical protein